MSFSFLDDTNCGDYAISRFNVGALKSLKKVEIWWDGSEITEEARKKFNKAMIESGF